MTPIQFVDWLDGALDLDELLHLNRGAGQIATELRDMIRNRMQSVERGQELQATQAELVTPASSSHPYSLTRDIKVDAAPPADMLTKETLAEVRDAVARKLAEEGKSLKSFVVKPMLADGGFVRSPIGIMNFSNLV